MKSNFEWDEKKAKRNTQKHGASFEEAITVLQDELSLTMNDPIHSIGEERFIDIGLSSNGHVLVVTYTERGSHIRIISCRKATPAERKAYETQID
ncbi:BrnT family toxin [bacterium]|nr:BrnT family toxin [bacterium]PIW20451.1 MAG: hypothetical protein COW33_02255 [Anaerolineae bacterium CG17_big_fil_post_rev_8_21_14_2_50_57_27]PIZ26464.1 MAG: hypothetical protein COY47_00345 [Chloroflexi bacterium CG_4_10_14_0_8_um_filter_57_5]PJH75822.1 MAG: hypothetical protein CO064_04560 [Anaerolineae bacterium CG_4_9_14_0_8_um_filter_58_9]